MDPIANRRAYSYRSRPLADFFELFFFFWRQWTRRSPHRLRSGVIPIVRMWVTSTIMIVAGVDISDGAAIGAILPISAGSRLVPRIINGCVWRSL